MSTADDLVLSPADAPLEAARALLFGLGNGVVFVLAVDPEAAFGTDGPPDPVCFFAGGQLIDLPNGLGLSWRHESERTWFRPRPDQIVARSQRLRLAEGMALRDTVVRDDAGRETRWRETRFVSLSHAGVVLLRWELQPLNWTGPILVRSQLDLRAQRHAIHPVWAHGGEPSDVHNLLPADGLAAEVTGPDAQRLRVDVTLRVSGAPTRPAGRGHDRDVSYQQRSIDVPEGGHVSIDVAMTLSEDPDAPVVAPGFEQECERQRAAWRMLWDRVPLSLPGDPMLAQACRFNAFHLLQAVSPLSVGRDVGLPAWRSPKGRPGHEPWDETLALPFYSLHLPALARELLHHRVRHLEADMPRAARAAVALAAWRHHLVTGDAALLAGLTAPLLIDCARYWAARDAASAGLPAAWTLGCAADLGAHLEPAAWARVCEDANVTPAELVAWRVHAAAVPVPWLPGDVLAVASGDGVDTLVLLHLLGPEAAHALLVRMGESPPAGWYARTVRHHAADGAAPAGVARLASAGALAAVDPDASFAHFHAAALGPLREPPGLDEGLSFATMGGVWDVLVRHYLGVQPEADGLHLRPRPPEGLGDVAVRVTVGRHRLAVSLDDDTLTVTTDPQAPPLRLWSGGMVHEVQPGVPWSVVCRGVVEMA